MSIPLKYSAASDTASSSSAILPHMYTKKQGERERITDRKTQITLRVTKNSFCEWEHECLRVFGRLFDRSKRIKAWEKGTWQRKEQDARRGGVGGGIRGLAGEKEAEGMMRVLHGLHINGNMG